jgi:hypothetical protein
MPIQGQTVNPIPFLLSYTPYSAPADTSVIDDINQMISYNLLPNPLGTSVNYTMGGISSYEKILRVKNITANTELLVTITYPPEFTITPGNAPGPISFNLSANNVREFIIKFNTTQLDSVVYQTPTAKNIEITINNINNGSLVLKNNNSTLLPTEVWPAEITI